MTEMDTSQRPWTGERGPHRPRDVAPAHSRAKGPIYCVAGPPRWLSAMQRMLAAAGSTRTNVRTEEFSGYRRSRYVPAGSKTEGATFVAKTSVPTKCWPVHGPRVFERATGKSTWPSSRATSTAASGSTARIHSECLTGEVLGSLKCDCRQQLDSALSHIDEHGGVVLYPSVRTERHRPVEQDQSRTRCSDRGHDTVEANHLLGFADDLRGYGSAIDMLRYLGISKVRLA